MNNKKIQKGGLIEAILPFFKKALKKQTKMERREA